MLNTTTVGVSGGRDRLGRNEINFLFCLRKNACSKPSGARKARILHLE